MAIELPSNPDVLAERLASLEDPLLAEQLFRENPALFAHEAPRTQREVLAWTTRRLGTALLAVTAAFSIAAGYFGSELARKHPAPARVAPHAASVAAAPHHARPQAHARTAPHPVAHVAQRPHAAAPPKAVPVVVHHTAVAHHAAVVQPVQPDRETLLLRARVHAQQVELARLRDEQAATAAALHAAAAQAAHRAAQAHARVATAAQPVPQPRPRTEPATATATTTTSASAPEPVGAGTPAGESPDPTIGGGVKTPPVSPGGIWNERIPGGGTVGGVVGPILVGTPRDSCTPRGGRVGMVLQAISELTRH